MVKHVPFLVIIALAIFLRFWDLVLVPPSPSLDEVSLGYNAYSILKTGADEYGTQFPVLLRAYDDWRPALYVYLIIPFVQFLGLNVLAVRLPSVILSILTVIATYFLVKELLKRGNLPSKTRTHAAHIALIASLLLSISPWHVYISRLGHEANAGLAFLVFAILFFLKQRIYLSAICFALSLISYQAEKIFLPIFLVSLFFLFKNEILSNRKRFILAVLLAGVLLFPFAKASLEPNALIRFQATSIFNTEKVRFDQQAKRLAKAQDEGNVVGQAIYNRRVLATQIVVENYIAHFNPEWLFLNQGEDRQKVPNLGLFYIWELPLLLLGFGLLLKGGVNRRIKFLILLWVWLSPLPGAVTSDAPHAMRMYTVLPVPQFISALGLFAWLSSLRNRNVLKATLFTLSLLVLMSMVYLYQQYFTTFPKTQSKSFQYALSRAIPFVLEEENRYDKVVFSNTDNLYQSYMFFLFHSRYDPAVYQKQGGTRSGGFAETHSFGKFEFRPIHWNDYDKAQNALYVGNISDFPNIVRAVFVFTNLDGQEAIKIVQ